MTDKKYSGCFDKFTVINAIYFHFIAGYSAVRKERYNFEKLWDTGTTCIIPGDNHIY